ncbi:MAG: NAD(P)H-dependent oxidoreductase [Candidatus Niyogibacteria bacterium]|nr:MAG: NAD(P)H-dependent oxidoreductase [Candidatus Niyogibacteria bacterium]
MTEKLFIPVILGTNREGRQSENVAKFLYDRMNGHEKIETKLFDVRDFNFPTNDYGQALKDKGKFSEYRDAIIKADGLVVVVPEYNHAYPGTLKSLLDVVLREYVHKAVGLVGVSAGPWGGTRAVESLVPVVRELGLAVTFSNLNFPQVQNTFDSDGKLKDDAYNQRADEFLEELIWMAETMLWGRKNLPSKYHQN